jgi:hypothetical protein
VGKQKQELKVRRQSGRAKARTKSERAKWELEGKLLPFSAFLFISMGFFSFHLLQKKKMLREHV